MKQLIVYADIEGSSGIFESNASRLFNGSDDWRNFGRVCITSDVLAVCSAATDFGIDDILLYDGHFVGNKEFNVELEKLPKAVRAFDTPDRRFFWRRIRGQALETPFGIITAGQHARFGEADSYFPHTIQSPLLMDFSINKMRIAEIGMAVLSFDSTPYLANIGCKASMRETLELSENIVTIPSKDKAKSWEPSSKEIYPSIYEETL